MSGSARTSGWMGKTPRIGSGIGFAGRNEFGRTYPQQVAFERVMMFVATASMAELLQLRDGLGPDSSCVLRVTREPQP